MQLLDMISGKIALNNINKVRETKNIKVKLCITLINLL